MLSNASDTSGEQIVSPDAAVDTHDRHDVARAGFVEVFATVGVHAEDAPDALLASGSRVDVLTALDDPGLCRCACRSPDRRARRPA